MHRAPDGTAYALTGPTDGAVVVLIHGLGLNNACWQWTTPALQDRFRVLRYDLYGHGQSAPPPETPSLALFSAQLAGLLDHCGMEQASIVGFSLGGMIARRFAQDAPHRTHALAILHSPHKRSPEAQKAIQIRVDQARVEGPQATVEAALERWFTDRFRHANPAMMEQVRGWVTANDIGIYHTIYRVLADGVDEIVTPDPGLSCPTLVMTGDEDHGNSPEMARAIAAEIPGAQTVVLPGLRHMALAEDPPAINGPLRDFLDRSHTSPAPSDGAAIKRHLRDAFGRFATGVTVVTTRAADGAPRGFTANSFTSVSLDPPLLLVCVAKAAHSCPAFAAADHFAVSILADDQRDVSGVFASQSPDKFALVNWHEDLNAMPLIDGALASFSCARHQLVDAGDHLILMGRITAFETTQGQPLGYYGGSYFDIGLDRAVTDAATAGKVSVAAVLAHENGVLLVESPEGNVTLPTDITVQALTDTLAQKALSPQLDHLYAVYQVTGTGAQRIVYHGRVDGAPRDGLRYHDLGALPLDRVRDDAERALLRRYAQEHRFGSFGIYHGTETEGVVHTLAGHNTYHI